MGATDFGALGANGQTDVDKALDDLVSAARHEHGHGGYTGTIAEAPTYIVIQREPVTRAELHELSRREFAKWGEPGCRIERDRSCAVRVKDEEFNGWAFFGVASL